MAVNVRREGAIDYILAAFAGGTTGAAKGLESRQARKEREAAAQTQARFKNLQLSLQQQGIDISRLSQESLDKFRDAQIEEKRLLREAAVPPLTFEQQKELKAIGPRKTPITVKEQALQDLEIRTGKAKALAAEQQLGINERTQQRLDDELAFKQAKEKAAGDVSDRDFQFELGKYLASRGDDELERKDAVYLVRLKAALERTDGELNKTEMFLVGTGMDAFKDALEFGDPLTVDVANKWLPKINEILAKYDVEMPKGKLQFTRKRFLGIDKLRKDPLEFIPEQEGGLPSPVSQAPAPLQDILGPLGAPPVQGAGNPILDNILGQQQPAAPAAQPAFDQTTDDIFAELNQILEQGRRKPTPSAEPQAPTTLPFNLPEVRLSKQPQAFEGTEFAAPTTNVESVITSLQNSGKTTISKAFKTSLKDLGFTDAEIKRIEKAIKAK